MSKGYLIVEGAKMNCNKGTLPQVPVIVKHKNDDRYTINGKKLVTWLEDDEQHFIFGSCSAKNNAPCKPQIKWKDYYKNLDFHGTNPLLTCSSGKCSVGGGDIKILSHGQTSTPSKTIAVNHNNDTYDLVLVSNTPIADLGENCSVSEIVVYNLPYKSGSTLNIRHGKNHELIFGALVGKGSNVSLVNWALFRGEDTSDRMKTWTHFGPSLKLKIVDTLSQGKYRIEAYVKKPGDDNCSFILNVTKNDIEKIIISPSVSDGAAKLIPYTFEAKYYFGEKSNDEESILDNIINNFTGVSPSKNLTWQIFKKDSLLYDSANEVDSKVLEVKKSKDSITVHFYNTGKYSIIAQDLYMSVGPQVARKHVETINVRPRQINSISMGARTNDRMRISQAIQLKAGKIKYDSFLPVHPGKAFWYVRCDGVVKPYKEAGQNLLKEVKATASNLAAIFNKNSPYQTYEFEAYGEEQKPKNGKWELPFSGNDFAKIEFTRNKIVKIEGPIRLPLGVKVSYKLNSILPIDNGESAIFHLTYPNGHTQEINTNNDSTQLDCNKLGIYTLNAQLIGDDADTTPLREPLEIFVQQAEVVEALWCYASGKKRASISWEEDSYCSVTIKGMEGQAFNFCVWALTEDKTIEETISEPDTYLLSRLSASSDKNGVAQIRFNTSEEVKNKVSTITSKPDHKVKLFFTLNPTNTAGMDCSNMILRNNGANIPVVDSSGEIHHLILDYKDFMTLPANASILSIDFTNEAGTDLQYAASTYGNIHKIQIHTCGMIKDKLTVKVYRLLSSKEMKESYNADENIFAVAKEVKEYPAEEVGQDSTLQLDFTIEDAWKEEAPELNSKDLFVVVYQKKSTLNAEGIEEVIVQKVAEQYTTTSVPHQLVENEDKTELRIRMAALAEGQDPTAEQLKREANAFLGLDPLRLRAVANNQEEISDTTQAVEVRGENVMIPKNCYCDKSLTVEEVKDIITTLSGVSSLFSASNCNLPSAEKTFELFTQKLNHIFSQYGINSCIRKIHFLAQICHETDKFATTLEYADGIKYDPGEHDDAIGNGNTAVGDGRKYKGRGLMQLTWKNNYRLYRGAKNIDVVSNYKKVSDETDLAFDTAGWFWKEGKALTNSARWTGPSNPPAYVAAQNPNYPKTEYTYDGITYGAVDMGLIADDDKVDLISYLVNGGANGIEERKDYVERLKTWFEYDRNVCNGQPALEFASIPWIVLAIEEEAETIRESTHCQYIKDTYHASTDNVQMTRCGSEEDSTRSNSAWCASFVNYCLETAGFSSQQDPGAIWYKDIHRVKRNSTGPYLTDEIWAKKESTLYTGGVVVWKSGGHTCFIVGIDKSNSSNYIVLGGNQDNGVRFWTIDKNKINDYCLFPIEYDEELIPLKEIAAEDIGPDVVFYSQGSTS